MIQIIKATVIRVRSISPLALLGMEEGSAIIEFVLLAVPLLIPIVMYLGVVHTNSKIHSDLHNLARQSARAFITSSDESFESARMQSILTIFEVRVLKPDGISEIPTLSVECAAAPCLTPNSRVKVTASLTHSQGQFSGLLRFIHAPVVQFSASDIQIVEAWR